MVKYGRAPDGTHVYSLTGPDTSFVLDVFREIRKERVKAMAKKYAAEVN